MVLQLRTKCRTLPIMKTARIEIRCLLAEKKKIQAEAKKLDKSVSNYLVESALMCGEIIKMRSGETGECVMDKGHNGSCYGRAILPPITTKHT